MIGLQRGIVKLIPYDKDWDTLYKKEEKNLKLVLRDVALDIQHIGSTAIQGMSAKPIIDIIVGLKSLKDIYKYLEILENNGYIFRKGSGTENRLLFIKGGESYRTHHIHVVEWNSEEWIRHVKFRDYLRMNIEDSSEYLTLKAKLAERYPNDREAYTNAKNSFIEKILRKAEY